MLTLGLSGGLDLVHERREHLFPRGSCHDAAAALVEDGRVVAAIEEERLNRIKHSSKGAVQAIRFCLATRGVSLGDVDALAFYGSEESCTVLLRNLFYGSCEAGPVTTPRGLIHELLRRGVGADLPDERITFVHHHLAHAVSAFAQSGLAESLVLTVDGAGDALCGSVSHWREGDCTVLHAFAPAQSLGVFYDRVIAMLGYGFTEEYKVMGLAPYGDRARYRSAFGRLYDLRSGGDYALHWDRLESLYALAPVRKPRQPLLREHVDLAAALQDALETIVLHVLTHWRARTGLTTLCMAGGVAHNSTLNGRILASALFDDVFVHPASHDAGCAVGAALHVDAVRAAAADPVRRGVPEDVTDGVRPRPARVAADRLSHVYWGTDIGTDDAIAATLARWAGFLDVTRVAAIAEHTAQALAEGRVIAWVQGRSEFGPRALGNRSIVADPRPAEHRDVINRMVKKREGYRPFAPAVLEERAEECFDIPTPGMRLPFMSFTVPVRAEWRAALGAVTHVDGTARVQTVSRAANPPFWELIAAFGERTGVPVLLNTSFNNDAEPIVDSVEDAIVCFLTTELHHLVVGHHFVSKRAVGEEAVLCLAAGLPPYARLVQTKAPDADGAFVVTHALAVSFDDRVVPVSPAVHELLLHACGARPLHELLRARGLAGAASEIAAELRALWARRLIVLRPAAHGAR